jgi:predicted HNH restriction endonuclease
MKIILSQRIDTVSDYDDVPFSTYHFPKRYRNQIHPGDRFIYYQGNRQKKDQRYYFGCGVIGKVYPDVTSDSFYAEILEGYRFDAVVPIYSPTEDGFLESLGFDQVRKKPNPSWQNSIRKISDEAFDEILRLGNAQAEIGEQTSQIEQESDALSVLELLNQQYDSASPQKQDKLVQRYLDRGVAVTNALKSLLGAKCQVCNWVGFKKKNGESFIEAHHIVQLSEGKEGSLCTDNVILLCPNCHKEVHYGDEFVVKDQGDYIEINLSKYKARVKKNTINYLGSLRK